MNRKVLLMSMLAFAPFSHAAEKCYADVEVISSRAQKNTAFISFRVSHDAGNQKLALIHFEYKINFIAKQSGNRLVERGIFHEHVRGPSETSTVDNISMFEIGDIISVDVESARCSK